MWKQNNDESRVSKFNPAMLKMQRLHEIRAEINRLNQFLTQKDPATGEENFKLKLRLLNSLYLETYPKLGKEEKKQGDKIVETVRRYIEVYPIWVKKNGSKQINKQNWDKIERALEFYERMVYIYTDKTGMDTPEEEEYQGL